jgi:hypothetical protein
MIYIFEDRDSRRILNQDVVTKHSDVICFAKFDIDTDQNLSDFIVNNFCDAVCLIFHKSYTFKDKNVNLPMVQDYMLKNGVKFCVYSGGIEYGSISKDGVTQVNSNVMYENLVHFINHYKDSNEVILEILLWGERYRLNQLKTLQYDLFNQFFISNALNEIIPSEDFDEILDDTCSKFEEYGFDIPQLSDKFKNSTPGLTWNEYFNLLSLEIHKIELTL